MKIINNKIYLSRGETATYDVSIIDQDTGAPFVLLENTVDGVKVGIDNPHMQFIVRPGVYDREDNYILKYNIDLSNIKKFNSLDIKSYTDGTTNPIWDNDVLGEEGYLYRRTVNNINDYRYWDPTATGDTEDFKWIPYEFRIIFTFNYADTVDVEAKQYKYELSLIGGTVKESPENNETPININYRKPILETMDFILGGSLSE